jgi:hypothetical protein
MWMTRSKASQEQYWSMESVGSEAEFDGWELEFDPLPPQAAQPRNLNPGPTPTSRRGNFPINSTDNPFELKPDTVSLRYLGSSRTGGLDAVTSDASTLTASRWKTRVASPTHVFSV